VLTRFWNATLSRSFDDWAETYDRDVVPMLARRGYGYFQLAEVVTELVGNQPASPAKPIMCFELGVGTGMLGSAVHCRRPEWQLHGLDISAEMLRRAAATGAYAKLFQGTAECLPVGSGTVDVLVSAFMMHSVMRRQLALAEMLRVLKPGGKVALVDLYRTTRRWPGISGVIDNVLSAFHERGAPSRYVSVDEMCRSLRQAGFRVSTRRLLDADEITAQKKAGKRMHGLVVATKGAMG
jgi:ubiquinone/menaquinone biosynthesis C-methylase UbiE